MPPKLIRTISAVLELFSTFEFEFVVVENVSKKQFDFLCVRGSTTYSVTVHVHVLWPVCTHHTFIPTVVVSLMIHDNMYIYVYVYVNMCVYAYLCVYNVYVCMCVCVCVVCCCFSSCQDRTDGELSLRSATSGETLVE